MSQASPSEVLYSGRVLPSGKLSCGRVPRKRILRADSLYELQRDHYTYYERRHWHHENGIVREYYARVRPGSGLGLSSVPNCHKPLKARHGLKGISNKGRVSVRECAYLLERKYGKRLGFYTLTCPYTDLQSIYSYNKNIAYIQRTYFQELKREYERKGCVWSYVSVLEIQVERFNRTGVPVLHLHYIAPCYLPGEWSWVVSADALRSIWGRVLQNCLGGCVPLGASVDSTVIRSSAVGYISKYMSKGSSEASFLADVCPDQLPSQWWSTSRNLRQALLSSTRPIPQDICAFLIYSDNADINHPLYLRYKRDVYATIQNEERLVGISGNMSPSQSWHLFGDGDFKYHLEDL